MNNDKTKQSGTPGNKTNIAKHDIGIRELTADELERSTGGMTDGGDTAAMSAVVSND